MNYQKLTKLIEDRIYEYGDNLEDTEKEFFLLLLENYPKSDSDFVINMPIGNIIMGFLHKYGVFEVGDVYACFVANNLDLVSAKKLMDNLIDGSFYKKNYVTAVVIDNNLGDAEDDVLKAAVNIFKKIIDIDKADVIKKVISIQQNYLDVQSTINEMKALSIFLEPEEKEEYKRRVEYLQEAIQSGPNMKPTIESLQEIFDYAKTVAGNLSYQELQKIVKSYNKLLQILKREDKQVEITNINQILKYAEETDIKEACLEYIYNHNMEYYIKLENEYEDKSKHSINAYISYFSTIDINFSSLDEKLQKIIMESSLDEIKEKMEIISTIAFSNNYIDVLINTTIEELEEIKKYISKEYLTTDFIKSNIDIFSDKEKFENLKENIQVLSSKTNLLKYEDKSFLLTENEIIRNNINLLGRLNISFSNCTDLSMLKEPLKDKIELFIEVGLEESIKENPDILNADISLAKKVIIERIISNNDETSIKNLLISDDFYISVNEIDRFMFDRDNSNYVNNTKVFISSEDSTELSYIVDGVIIPKTRIQSQPVELSKIIRPSLYNKEEIKKLEKLL